MGSFRAPITYATTSWLKFLHDTGVSVKAKGRYEVGSEFNIDFEVGDDIFRVQRLSTTFIGDELHNFVAELNKEVDDKKKRRELAVV